jgi:mycothiol synthase
VSEVRVHAVVPESAVEEIQALTQVATVADGVGPFSEHALLWLRHGGGGARGLTVAADGVVVGYAHLDPATESEPASGEVVVHPEHRRRGYGRALLDALLDTSGGAARVWAHGDLPAAAGLAASRGLTRVRALLQMRRPAGDPLPEVALAAGVRLRPFTVGADEDAWLVVNARAFADHPEQGAWTVEDVRRREAEPWFDPAGFFLAERDGRLLGFHWTKVHSLGSGSGGSLGEVYVVGVDPDARGLGLGRALTVAGLRHLRDGGTDQIMLYVDEDNTAAVGLYASLGFARHAVDVMYGTEVG